MVSIWHWQGPETYTPRTSFLDHIESVLNKIQGSSWYGGKDRPNIVLTLSKHGPNIVSKSGHLIHICLSPSWLNFVNVIALAGLEVKLGQTWSQQGPCMVPKNRNSMEMVLSPYGFSVENFSALAGLEVNLSQTWFLYGPNMALIWS